VTTRLKFGVAGQVGGRLISGLLSTARFSIENEAAWRGLAESGRPFLFMPWHGRLLPLSWLHRRQGIVGLVSRSADGEYIARVLRVWGYDVVRGSSSRGGDVAFRELVRLIRSGRTIAITPDGPRGPKERIKPGIVQLAQLSGAPILPMAGGADRAWWFESWDRFLVPKPFARIRVAYADPVFVPRQADAAQVAEMTARLERIMGQLMERVDDHG
jgi:lysophospholipid acyltransferase (LPLAT)-like uncharacterized protein